MRISHTELEVVRQNPRRWLETRQAPHGFAARPKMQCWQDAIRRYHEAHGDTVIALQYLEGRFLEYYKQNSKNARDLVYYSESLLDYCGSFESLPHIANKFRHRIEYHVSDVVYLVGEIGRLDSVLPIGYAVTLFHKEEVDWQSDLRMPLLQDYFAKKYGCPLDEVKVGFYSFSRSQHEYVNYSPGQVRAAVREVKEIVREIEALIGD